MGITSINLSTLPFMGSCDSTRANMASKQMSQALTHKNCEIPYIISHEYRNLVNNSIFGICIAQDDGEVVLNRSEIIIIYYHNLKKIETFSIPIIKKTTGMFSSTLRFCLQENAIFKKDDVIFSYDNFKNGIPSFGYNVMTAYMAGFGFNHEDSLIISQNFANKAKITLSEKVYIPVFDHTILLPIYKDIDDSFIYFPNIGQKIKGTTVCSILKPNINDITDVNNSLKNKMMMFFKNITLSDLLNINNQNNKNIKVEEIKTKIENGVITGINVHKIQKDTNLIDPKFQLCLEQLYLKYCEDHLFPTFSELHHRFNQEFALKTVKQYIKYTPDPKTSNRSLTKNSIYLIEIEITREDSSQMGDKFCNR